MAPRPPRRCRANRGAWAPPLRAPDRSAARARDHAAAHALPLVSAGRARGARRLDEPRGSRVVRRVRRRGARAPRRLRPRLADGERTIRLRLPRLRRRRSRARPARVGDGPHCRPPLARRTPSRRGCDPRAGRPLRNRAQPRAVPAALRRSGRRRGGAPARLARQPLVPRPAVRPWLSGRRPRAVGAAVRRGARGGGAAVGASARLPRHQLLRTSPPSAPRAAASRSASRSR